VPAVRRTANALCHRGPAITSVRTVRVLDNLPATTSTNLEAILSIGKISSAASNAAAALGMPYTALVASSCAIV
jgi:hypothetical protein